MSLKITDSHLHWRDPVSNRYEALSDGVSEDGDRGGSEAQLYMPEDYHADAEGYDIVGCVHVEAEWDRSDPAGETRWLHELAERDATGGVPIVIVGFADLADPGVEPVLEAHAGGALTRGIRQMLNRIPGNPALCWADREYLADPLWQRNFGLLARYGLDFDLMCFSHQMGPMAELAARHPDIRVHLEHTGMPWDHSEAGREVWRTGMRALAALEHVDVKISGLGNTVPDWDVDKIRDYVLETIDIFGIDRVSFASNFPTDKQFSDMATIWRAFDEITRGFSQAERDAMFVENALRAYRFPVLKTCSP